MPLKVVLVRVQSGNARGVVHASRQLYAEGGLGAFFQGARAAFVVMVNPAMTYVVYERLRGWFVLRRRASMSPTRPTKVHSWHPHVLCVVSGCILCMVSGCIRCTAMHQPWIQRNVYDRYPDAFCGLRLTTTWEMSLAYGIPSSLLATSVSRMFEAFAESESGNGGPLWDGCRTYFDDQFVICRTTGHVWTGKWRWMCPLQDPSS